MMGKEETGLLSLIMDYKTSKKRFCVLYILNCLSICMFVLTILCKYNFHTFNYCTWMSGSVGNTITLQQEIDGFHCQMEWSGVSPYRVSLLQQLGFPTVQKHAKLTV